MGKSYRRPSNNAASRAGSTIQTQRYNDDGSLSVINEPYTKPTTYTQSDRNTTQGISMDSTNLTNEGGWAGFFKGNSPLGVRAGFSANTPALANAAQMQTPAAPIAPVAAIPPPSNNGFSFGAGMSGPSTTPAPVPLTPMTAADHINAAVSKGQAAASALGLPPVSSPRTFGSSTASNVANISGAPQVGDTIVSKYGTGSVNTASNVNAAQRLQKLAAPDYSDLGIYG